LNKAQNVDYKKGEEHSKLPKEQRGIRGARGARGVVITVILEYAIEKVCKKIKNLFYVKLI